MNEKKEKVLEIIKDANLSDEEKATKICMVFYFEGESSDYVDMEFDGYMMEQKGLWFTE